MITSRHGRTVVVTLAALVFTVGILGAQTGTPLQTNADLWDFFWWNNDDSGIRLDEEAPQIETLQDSPAEFFLQDIEESMRESPQEEFPMIEMYQAAPDTAEQTEWANEGMQTPMELDEIRMSQPEDLSASSSSEASSESSSEASSEPAMNAPVDPFMPMPGSSSSESSSAESTSSESSSAEQTASSSSFAPTLIAPLPPEDPPKPGMVITIPTECVVCEYQETSNCKSAETRAACQALNDGFDDECVFTNGACVNQFEQACRTSLAGVEGAIIQPASREPAQGVDLSSCTSITRSYMGHSGPALCSDQAKDAMRCLTKAPSCSSLTWINEGCQTFKNLDEADKWAQWLSDRLPQGARVVLKGNQAEANPDVCTSYVSYEITCDAVITSYGACHAANSACFREGRAQGEVIRCTATGGEVSSEICCADNTWHSGSDESACPAPQVAYGTCTESAWHFLCANAVETARWHRDRCLEQQRTACTQNGGQFRPDFYCQERESAITLGCMGFSGCGWSCTTYSRTTN